MTVAKEAPRYTYSDQFDEVKTRFKVGDVIRNINPYFGEAARRILEVTEYGFICEHLGGILGPYDDKPICEEVPWHDFARDGDDWLGKYEICSWPMRIWLCILGNTLGRL